MPFTVAGSFTPTSHTVVCASEGWALAFCECPSLRIEYMNFVLRQLRQRIYGKGQASGAGKTIRCCVRSVDMTPQHCFPLSRRQTSI